MLIAGRMGRFRLLPHLVACAWLIGSPFLFAVLVLPKIADDEAPGPGDGLILLPILLFAVLMLAGYCVALLALVARVMWNWSFGRPSVQAD